MFEFTIEKVRKGKSDSVGRQRRGLREKKKRHSARIHRKRGTEVENAMLYLKAGKRDFGRSLSLGCRGRHPRPMEECRDGGNKKERKVFKSRTKKETKNFDVMVVR